MMSQTSAADHSPDLDSAIGDHVLYAFEAPGTVSSLPVRRTITPRNHMSLMWFPTANEDLSTDSRSRDLHHHSNTSRSMPSDDRVPRTTLLSLLYKDVLEVHPDSPLSHQSHHSLTPRLQQGLFSPTCVLKSSSHCLPRPSLQLPSSTQETPRCVLFRFNPHRLVSCADTSSSAELPAVKAWPNTGYIGQRRCICKNHCPLGRLV
jgi:hypothetical protein